MLNVSFYCCIIILWIYRQWGYYYSIKQGKGYLNNHVTKIATLETFKILGQMSPDLYFINAESGKGGHI